MTLDITTVPASLNGHPVIERRLDNIRGETAVVMALRIRHDLHPYVVARWWPELGASWHKGDYCATAAEAAEAFTNRLGD
jgi:hypothetical protein